MDIFIDQQMELLRNDPRIFMDAQNQRLIAAFNDYIEQQREYIRNDARVLRELNRERNTGVDVSHELNREHNTGVDVIHELNRERNTGVDLIDELNRELQLLNSTASIRRRESVINAQEMIEEYLNNDNAAQAQQREMVENHLQMKTHVEKGGEDYDVCSICLDEFVEGSSVGVLNCGHEFHSGCVKKWVIIKNVCPLCRSTGVR